VPAGIVTAAADAAGPSDRNRLASQVVAELIPVMPEDKITPGILTRS
jgi:hypothetical protein